MRSFTVWIKKSGVTLLIGGNPKDGKTPIVTAQLENPQVQIDPERGEIVIIETK